MTSDTLTPKGKKVVKEIVKIVDSDSDLKKAYNLLKHELKKANKLVTRLTTKIETLRESEKNMRKLKNVARGELRACLSKYNSMCGIEEVEHEEDDDEVEVVQEEEEDEDEHDVDDDVVMKLAEKLKDKDEEDGDDSDESDDSNDEHYLLEGTDDEIVGDVSDSATKDPLEKEEPWKMFGQKGEKYDQRVIELGMSLMSVGLTTGEAVKVLRKLMKILFPHKKQSTHRQKGDYRIPHRKRFGEWRRWLKPMAEYMAIQCVAGKDTVATHIASDATKKNNTSVLGVIVRVEKMIDGRKVIIDVPLKLAICSSGDAQNEARIIEEAHHTEACGGAHATLQSVQSSITDNAAKKASEVLGERKANEFERAKHIVENHIQNYPESLQPAIDAFLKLDPAQRDVVREIHILTCVGHSINLTVNASFTHETETTKKNIARYLEAKKADAEIYERISQRAHIDISELCYQISKLFSQHGVNSKGYLNER